MHAPPPNDAPAPTIMNPNEAHDYTMGVVRELQAAGIAVTVKPYNLEDENGKRTVAKYGSLPDHASPDKWCNVDLRATTDEHRQLLRQRQKELGWLGIHFDSGGGMGVRDWELDWSFRLTEGVPDSDREQAVDMTNDLIDGLENGTLEGPPVS